jgi:ribosomal-protein-alanine N-acetyltransferase
VTAPGEDSGVITIRPYVLGDLPRVIRIERISFGRDSYSLTTFLAHVMRDRRGLLVAEGEPGEVIGYVLVRMTLGWLGVRRGGLTSIAVHPAHRRRGAGRALMGRALERLREHGVKEADLEVGVDNRAAQSLYETFGFRRSHLLPHYYGLNRDGLKMVLDLTSAQAGRSGAAAACARRASNG